MEMKNYLKMKQLVAEIIKKIRKTLQQFSWNKTDLYASKTMYIYAYTKG